MSLDQEAALICSGLTHVVAGGESLREVGFEVARGEVLGLLGPTGSGVALLLDALSGLRPPKAGGARVLGRPLDLRGPGRIARSGLARTFAAPALPPEATPLDLVELAGRLRAGGGPWRLLRPMRKGKALPLEAGAILGFLGLTAVAKRPLGTLTPAQRRLADLARALAQRPGVLLLDNPFWGLSAAERQHAATLVDALADEGMAVVLADHDLSWLTRLAPRLLVLDAGRVIAQGPPAAVGEEAEVLRAFVGREAV